MPVVIIAVRFVLCSGRKNDMPVHRRVIQRKGNVTRSRKRRPNVSMVKKAGRANTQFKIPVPIENSKAWGWV
jgi:hypothetical protein